MAKFCLEKHEDRATIIHRVDCPAYDLATLLGLGCVTDLGEFSSVVLALETIRLSHPEAVGCPDCCKADVLHFPRVARPFFSRGIVTLSS